MGSCKVQHIDHNLFRNGQLHLQHVSKHFEIDSMPTLSCCWEKKSCSMCQDKAIRERKGLERWNREGWSCWASEHHVMGWPGVCFQLMGLKSIVCKWCLRSETSQFMGSAIQKNHSSFEPLRLDACSLAQTARILSVNSRTFDSTGIAPTIAATITTSTGKPSKWLVLQIEWNSCPESQSKQLDFLVSFVTEKKEKLEEQKPSANTDPLDLDRN